MSKAQAIEKQLKAIRWEVAVLDGWMLDDWATRRRRAQALVLMAKRLERLFDPATRAPAPENTKERLCQVCAARAQAQVQVRFDADDEAHAEAMEAAFGPHGQG